MNNDIFYSILVWGMVNISFFIIGYIIGKKKEIDQYFDGYLNGIKHEREYQQLEKQLNHDI